MSMETFSQLRPEWMKAFKKKSNFNIITVNIQGQRRCGRCVTTYRRSEESKQNWKETSIHDGVGEHLEEDER